MIYFISKGADIHYQRGWALKNAIGYSLDDRVAFLESRKAAAAIGATDEWNKMEGVAFMKVAIVLLLYEHQSPNQFFYIRKLI